MLDILEDYINTSMTPAQSDMIREANVVFDAFSTYLTNVDETYAELLMTDETRDQGETAHLILDVTQDALVYLLGMFGIKVVDGCQIDVMNKMLSGMILIESYENRVEILDIISLDHSPEEILALLLDTLTELTAEDVLLNTESVTLMLLGRIKETLYVRERDLHPGVDVTEIMPYIDRLKHFMKIANVSESIASDCILKGMSPGSTYKSYLSAIGDKLDNSTPKDIARELMALAYISSDGTTNPAGVVNKSLENLLHDLDLITKTGIEVTNWMVATQNVKN